MIWIWTGDVEEACSLNDRLDCTGWIWLWTKMIDTCGYILISVAVVLNDTINFKNRKLQTNCKPSIGTDGRVVSSQVCVDSPFILQWEPLRLAVSSDGTNAAERLLKMRVDWTTTNAVQTLELTRGAKIVLLNPKVQCTKRDDQSNEDRRWRRYDCKSEGSCQMSVC